MLISDTKMTSVKQDQDFKFFQIKTMQLTSQLVCK